MKILKNITLLLLMVASASVVFAQEDWEKNDGEIEDVEIEIVKDREITLPKANRNFEKIAPLNFSIEKPSLDYFFSNLQLPIPALKIRVRPLKMKDQPLNKLYGNYVRAGFGNFITPYVEGYFSSKRNRDYLYGAHVNFLNSKNGPVGDENSGSGLFDVDVFGKSFGETITLSADVGFKRRSYHFYGYPEEQIVSSDSIEQNFSNFSFKTSIENTDKSAKLDYLVGLQFDYLQDNFSAEESEVQLDFKGTYTLGEHSAINLSSDLDIISQKDEQLDVKTRNIFRVLPKFTFEYEGFLIDAGFNMVYENDTLGDSDEIHFYPNVKARYSLSSGFEVHAGIRGDVNKITLRQLVNENPFLTNNIRAFNSYNTFEFFGGIGGTLTSKLGFEAGMSVANYKNMPFFINNPVNQASFIVAYDEGNTAVLNINGKLSYNNSEQLRLTLAGDYWGYDTDEVAEPWHRPNYRLSAQSTYSLFDKFRFETEVYTLGGIKAFDFNTDSEVSLDAFVDLNITAEYLVSNQFSGWIRLNNVLSNEYEMLYNYPSRGLQIMIGASYSF